MMKLKVKVDSEPFVFLFLLGRTFDLAKSASREGQICVLRFILLKFLRLDHFKLKGPRRQIGDGGRGSSQGGRRQNR